MILRNSNQAVREKNPKGRGRRDGWEGGCEISLGGEHLPQRLLRATKPFFGKQKKTSRKVPVKTSEFELLYFMGDV